MGAPLVLALLAATGARDVPDVPADTLPAELSAAPPAGLPLAWTPPGDDDAAAALGRRLFFEPRLSVDGSVACASCHRPDHGFADPRPRSGGAHGRETTRHAPALLNRALGEAFMWDGRAATLEEQVLQPIENPLEMDLRLDGPEGALARLAADAGYARAFEATFGRAPDREALAASLAAFVRRLWSAPSPVDAFRGGDVAALGAEERAGLWLYESRGGCWRCHPGPTFTDEGFHNTGVGVVDGRPEEGRAAITGDGADRGRFKTPTLRGLARTGPYMHDGSLATLEDVVEHYRRGGNANPGLDPVLAPLELSDEDAAHLVAFLKALSARPVAAPGEAADAPGPGGPR